MSDYIPEDVLIQILELLPAESLVRCRMVCKWMNDFIDSPSFIQRHLALQKPRFISIYRGREFLVVNPHTPFIASAPLARRSESERVNLVGTLHGVVCFYYSYSHFLLCNISIRKSLILPLHVEEKYDRFNVGTYIHSGFWIDPLTKDFKIVIFYLRFPSVVYIQNAVLYSSVEQDWKPLVGDKVRMYPRLSDTPAVVIGEVGYWRIWGQDLQDYEDEDDDAYPPFKARIASFDFVKQEFYMIGGPEYVTEDRLPPVLSRWRDKLSLLYVNYENDGQVYVLQGEEDWVRMLTLNLLFVPRVIKVLSMVEYEGEDSDSAEELQDNTRILVSTGSNELVLCDNSTAYIVSKGGYENYDFTFSVAYDYVGSLVFPQVKFN